MKKTDSNEKRGGIYIHIPFCVRKCAYCDFLSALADEKTQAEYVKALQTEIYQTAKLLSENPYTVDTVFFGGGTPSILAPGHVKALADTLRESFPFAENAEITIECNPGTLDEEKAAVYRQAGINRISFGLQSANNRELKMLGRIHTMEEFVQSYETARAAGFDNINIDLMSALPGQTFESFLHTLDTVLALKPEHISMYSLILEEGTALYEHLDRYPALPDEDTERQMYDTACLRLADNGYHQYEISNFAKEGKACRHNLSYWERKNYLGFGTGAASLLCEQRYTNTDSLALYIDTMAELEEKKEVISKALAAVRAEHQQRHHHKAGEDDGEHRFERGGDHGSFGTHVLDGHHVAHVPIPVVDRRDAHITGFAVYRGREQPRLLVRHNVAQRGKVAPRARLHELQGSFG